MDQEGNPLHYNGTVYSSRSNLRPFDCHAPEEYLPLIGEKRLCNLFDVAERLKGLSILDLNATAKGGGVAEMLYSSVPFLDVLGLQSEWKTIGIKKAYFQCTKEIHNLLHGKSGELTPDMEKTYFETLTVLAGGMASDDPEGEQMLSKVYFDTKDDDDIHVLNLSLDDRLENYREVNALQRASSLIMHPAVREGFGLVITEALWKSKPVIATNVGAIPLQIRDGDTDFFFESPEETAKIAVYLLENEEAARLIGERGHNYVADHFLLPDRILDYLRCIEMTLTGKDNCAIPPDAIIGFHPWFKLTKRPSVHAHGIHS